MTDKKVKCIYVLTDCGPCGILNIVCKFESTAFAVYFNHFAVIRKNIKTFTKIAS